MKPIASRTGRAVRALTAATAGAAAIVVIVACPAKADPGPAPAPPVIVTTPGSTPSPVTPGIYGPLVGGGTMAPPPQPTGTDVPASSDPGFFDIPGQIEKAINTWFGNLVKSALGPVLKLVSSVLLSSPDVSDGRIAEVWTGTLVTANTLYILFVLVGGVIVMGHETVQSRYSLKQIAPRLVIGVIASNASLWAIEQSVSLGNALSSAILDRPVSAEGIGAQLTSMIVDKIFLSDGVGTLFMILLGGAVTVLGLVLLIAYLIRAAILIVLTAGAPLAFACHALPQTEGLAKLWWRGVFACLATQFGQALVLITCLQVLFDPHAELIIGVPSGGGLIDLLLCLCLFFILIKIPIWATRIALGRQPFGGTMASGLLRNFLYYKAFTAMRGRSGRRQSPPHRPPGAAWTNRSRPGPPAPGGGPAPIAGPRPSGGGPGGGPQGRPAAAATRIRPSSPPSPTPPGRAPMKPPPTSAAPPPGRTARPGAPHRAVVAAPPFRGQQYGLFPPVARPVRQSAEPSVATLTSLRSGSGAREALFPEPRPQRMQAPRAAAPVRAASGSASTPAPLVPVFLSAAEYIDPAKKRGPRAPKAAPPHLPRPASVSATRWPAPHPTVLPEPVDFGKDTDPS
ncbi:hypothetical protein KGQ19_00810 [Catenulispora sp. NL8]|uniref:TrbL/VirB6 plasmid conjugal transfer protein n=1 Tax=Catenulispora pinistramenti TaxID=2705254 RepID=A0ABS5KHE2_9ACTN|nr:hypothetical protein [Catenulispora pinistramenti]MBS2545400.1 hypothetical protein [Catenulispora pinistramenti]